MSKLTFCCATAIWGMVATVSLQAQTLSGPPRIGKGSVSGRLVVPPDRQAQAFVTPLAAGAATGGGIVYICDATIPAAACNTLNTTIAGLYNTVFLNANATIYVKLGVTGLGMSNWVYNATNYGTLRSLLIAAETDGNDVTAVTGSLPPSNPLGSNTDFSIELPTALQRALGFATPVTGLNSSGAFCTPLGSSGCYDGLITISNSEPLFFRTGSITGRQCDFFSVVEHETDEVLGTGSCAIPGSCPVGMYLPSDYFRYHSDGTRSHAAGTNDLCSSIDSSNACFSLDGVHFLQQYNNVSGGDAGDWLTNCAVPRVQDADTCSGTAGVDISTTAEILALDVFGYTLRNPSLQVLSSANPATVWLAPGSLASASGTDLATSIAGIPQLPLPVAFGGTSVSIRDSSGAVSMAPLLYVAPSLVNFEVPPGLPSGAAQVTIASGDGTQSLVNVQIAPIDPGLFALNGAGLAAAVLVLFHSDNTQTVEQVYTTDSSGNIVANPVSVGASTDYAYLCLFGTGLQAAGTQGVVILVGELAIKAEYAGPQGFYIGLDQVNVLLPFSLAGSGNVPIRLFADGYAANTVNFTIQ